MAVRRKFRLRSAASYTVFLSFIILAFSGVVMYLRPEGSVARWTSWNLLGIDKQGWEGFHTLFAILFMCSVSIHIFFNWKVLLGFLRNKIAEGVRSKKELAAAVTITLAVLILSITRLDPFWKIIEWREAIKKGGHIVEILPPAQDTDKLLLTEIADLMDTPLQDIVRHIIENGYTIPDTGVTLKQLADQNKISPEQMFLDIVDK
ncbi:DUF4405 domain-containing protein [candidate division KSB1 bacterium]